MLPSTTEIRFLVINLFLLITWTNLKSVKTLIMKLMSITKGPRMTEGNMFKAIPILVDLKLVLANE